MAKEGIDPREEKATAELAQNNESWIPEDGSTDDQADWTQWQVVDCPCADRRRNNDLSHRPRPARPSTASLGRAALAGADGLVIRISAPMMLGRQQKLGASPLRIAA